MTSMPSCLTLIFFVLLLKSRFLIGLENAPSYSQAERLFCEMLYQDAIPVYESLLNIENKNNLIQSNLNQRFIKDRLVECYLELGDLEKAQVVLIEKEASPYLRAVAYRKTHRYLDSINTLKDEPITAEISFELGLNHYLLDDYVSAQEYFNKAVNNSQDNELSSLATLYLIRIALLESNPFEADRLLTHFKQNIPLHHRSEWSQVSSICEEMKNESEQLYKILGMTYLKENKKEMARELFKKQLIKFSCSKNEPETRFLLSKCLEDENEVKKELRHIYIHFPESPYSSIAYFSFYSYLDYFHGGKEAIKHLISFPTLFPDSPLILNAYYLMGLYYKKDHLSQEGRVLRYQNLTAAIEAFQSVESQFERLSSLKNTTLDRGYYSRLCYKSRLERGRANLSIAEASQETKRQIYLEYTIKTLTELAEELSRELIDLKLLNETEFSLAQAHLKNGQEDRADKLYELIIQRNIGLSDERGYLLSRAFFERGWISLNRERWDIALESFIEAEKRASGLSNDETLDLWMKQSLCCQKLSRLDEAMRLLSKVINADMISGLRVEAMLQRAEIYEIQGKSDLARKQLKAVIKKGGDWAQKAKEIEEKRYGNF
jgi:hypothetical protein